MPTLQERVLDILVNSKLLSQEKREVVLKAKKSGPKTLKEILIEQGLVSERQLLQILSNELSLPFLDLTKYKLDLKLMESIPERFIRRTKIIPLSKIGKVLTVATSDPLNILALDELRALCNLEVEQVLASEADIVKAVDDYYKPSVASLPDVLKGVELEEISAPLEEEGTLEMGEVISESQKAPIVKVVDLLISEALRSRASDIHIEPTSEDLKIRYRIDGLLHEVFSLPKRSQNAILARLKIISNLDITESRLPQDGRFKVRQATKEVDFRVSCLPTVFGQKFVLRLLDRTSICIGLEKLGFHSQGLELFKQAVERPFGMILVTGPTGSGKSTTLYSIISKLNIPERNIITVEDPVEYQIEGIGQIQVKPEIGLNFAAGLRSLLRQSPDIIMIGEIRDSETADIAIKSSLTGQLVLTTLHTNDAAGAITRLIDMGVEPYLISSSIIMTCAQRLCRRICPNCKEPHSIPVKIIKELGIKDEKEGEFYHGRGCRACRQSGYLGRIAILEVLMLDNTIKDMISSGESSERIKEYAVNSRGMKTLRDDAIEKFASGVTTLEEVLRVTSGD